MIKFEIFRKAEQTSINWSGGTSTQLAIYPEQTTFAERNFLFRLSTATIEVEKSTFTDFGDIQRILMILEGKITLTQKDKAPFSLSDYQCVSFPGNLPTECEGTARDFNLMLREGSTGSVTALKLNAGESTSFLPEDTTDFFALYVHKGSVEIKRFANTICNLSKDDLFLIEKKEFTEFQIHATENTVAILAEINLG